MPPYWEVDMPPYWEVDIPPYCEVDKPPCCDVDKPPPCDVLKLRGHVLKLGIKGLLIKYLCLREFKNLIRVAKLRKSAD